AGKAIRAWGWQMLTDLHGPIIMSQAYEPGRRVFDYDEQEAVYAEVVRLCNEALEQLNRTGNTASRSFWQNEDLIYEGDTEKWEKFVYGLLAVNAHNLSNKAGYDPQQVIDYVDQSFSGNEDNASVRTEGSVNDDTNFFGPRRDNITNFRQTVFILGLLNGETFGITDPRLPVMLVPAPDGEYRGVQPTFGYTDMPEEERPHNLWNTPSLPEPEHEGKFLFRNDQPIPLMTYFQLQFIKAEAALEAGNRALALEAYRNGIAAHMEFCGIAAEDMNAYMASEAVAQTAGELTLSDIMLQKYIALWGWGFLETWNDLRRYSYSPDVFTGFQLPPAGRLYPDNQGKPAYRFRARYNSE
ncbi:MAG TPA: SusD/RagB family nutrient-binding outer membrane lipoprotein, partial [Anseongella sp.]|nr:SusD/RagB family nutrient-binding outer membrane lipoprotein [Anseongella sp.]